MKLFENYYIFIIEIISIIVFDTEWYNAIHIAIQVKSDIIVCLKQVMRFYQAQKKILGENIGYVIAVNIIHFLTQYIFPESLETPTKVNQGFLFLCKKC